MRQLEELFRALNRRHTAAGPNDDGNRVEWPEDPVEPPNDGQDGNVGDVNGVAGQDNNDEDDEEEDKDFPERDAAAPINHRHTQPAAEIGVIAPTDLSAST
jgi:hypothetical protein